MFRCLIYSTEKNIKNEVTRVLDAFPDIRPEHFSSYEQFEKSVIPFCPLIMVIAENIETVSGKLHLLYSRFPQLYFIYYYPSLQSNALEFAELDNFSHIIVGEKREKYLETILKNLVNNFWKKIPYEKLGFSYDQLSARIKKVMNYVELHDLKNCATAKIARQLEISQGYLSQEFKRETGLSFREFMQRLLDHYERIIFDQMKMSAKTAARLLGYSELSSFSRSFKKRKGYPPSQQKVQQHDADSVVA